LRALLILTVRNEGAFLIDWLAWHRHVGFTDFLVFSNDCTDGTDLMLDRLAAMGWLTHVPNPGPHEKGAQWAALKAANAHPLKQHADWVLTADIDEYVMIHAGGGRLADLFAALPEATAIPLTWRLFGNGGVIRRDGRPVPEAFTRAAPAVMGWPWRAAMFKTLIRNDGSYRALGVHRPKDPTPEGLARQRWFDGSGRELPADFHTARLFSPFGRDNYGLVQLNHYALGSMEDYVLKCDRGRANRAASAFDLSYWVERNLCAVEDRAMADRFPAARSETAALRADPALAELETRARGWRSDRFRQLMADEAYRSLLGRLMMAPHSRLLSERESRFLFDLARQNQWDPAAGTDGAPETR
jgi:hypothetical protein